MKAFEYMEVEPPRSIWAFNEAIPGFLNEHGADGWELVHLEDVTAIFKREVKQSLFDNFGGCYVVYDGLVEVARWAPGPLWSDYARSIPEGLRYEWEAKA